jgi:hypothetical protein
VSNGVWVLGMEENFGAEFCCVFKFFSVFFVFGPLTLILVETEHGSVSAFRLVAYNVFWCSFSLSL